MIKTILKIKINRRNLFETLDKYWLKYEQF